MFEAFVPSYIATLAAYPPGKPLEELERELGITDSIKLASNENPLGPSPLALEAIRANLDRLHRYPDANNYYLKERLSRHLQVATSQLICGNGSDEILELIMRAFIQPGDEVISATPSFLMYGLLTQGAGGIFRSVPLKTYRVDLAGILQAITARTKVVIINNPNNPTGTVVTRQEWEDFLQRVPPHVLVVVDEAYIEFADTPTVPQGVEYLREDRPLLGLRTFSKAYGLAGLRVGYGYGPSTLVGFLERLRSPFSVNLLAQAAAVAALDDEAFLARTRQVVREGLAYLCAALDELGLRYVPTQANFLLIHLGRDSREIYERLLRQGVIIRAMGSYQLPEYIRVNAGLPAENQRFIASLRQVLGYAA